MVKAKAFICSKHGAGGEKKKAKKGSSDISFGRVINSATNGLVFCTTMMLAPLELMIFFIYQKERYINHG